MPNADDRSSKSDAARSLAARRDVLPAVAALLLAQGGLMVVDPDEGGNIASVAWAMLPLIPVLWLGWAQLRALGRADELQRIVQLEAMAIGFGTMVVLAMAGGLLQAAGRGDARQSLQVVFIGGTLSWLAGFAFRSRRTR